MTIPDDVLVRVFPYLASPAVKDDLLLSPSSSAPLLSNKPDSPATALGQTCCRLHIFYHRAIRLVDVRQSPCDCGAPPSLQAFPFADAIVLNEPHVALKACTDNASLSRVRALDVNCFPHVGYAKNLLEAVPNLRDLLFSCRKYLPGLWHVENDVRELQDEIRHFVTHLPPGLRRVSLLPGISHVPFAGFWNSISRLEELEELNVSDESLHYDKVFGVSAMDSMAKIRECRRLRRFSLRFTRLCNSVVNNLMSVLPPSLSHLLVFDTFPDLVVTDIFPSHMQLPLVDDEARQGLQTLRLLTCPSDLQLLQPVASQLRILHIQATKPVRASVGFVPDFPRLEELHLAVGSEGRHGFDDKILKWLLSSAPVLRLLSLSLTGSRPNFTGKKLEAVLSSTTNSLRSLFLHLSTHLLLPQQFESIAAAIGDKFNELQELDLKNTLVTPACLTAMGQKHPLLSSLKLGSGKPRVTEASPDVAVGRNSAATGNYMATTSAPPAAVGVQKQTTKVEHMATAIGSHFSQITVLDLSGTDISCRGLRAIGHGCLLVKYLSLVRCP